jgi:hypothetical protein
MSGSPARPAPFVQLRHALQFPGNVHVLTGDLAAAAQVIEEDRLIADVTGPSPAAIPPMLLAAWRGEEAMTIELTEAIVRDGTSRGLHSLVRFALMARSVLFNGLGRYGEAFACARRAFDRDQNPADPGHRDRAAIRRGQRYHTGVLVGPATGPGVP